MRASAFARRTAGCIEAQVALGSLNNGLVGIRIQNRLSALVTNFNHADIAVRATVCTCLAPDTGCIVNGNSARLFNPRDGTGWAANQANWINTMHASIGDHQISFAVAMSNKARVVVVGRGASAHAIIATGTTSEVDQHRRRAVHVTAINDEVQTPLRILTWPRF